ncbi:MAG: hypothetical protein CMF51_04325 [Legionellales bacterium]|nr:hypothetical protein [Legionellales bacterium]
MTAVINNPVVVIIPALSIIIGGLAALAFLKGREAFKDEIGKQIARSVAPGILSWVVGCGVGLLVMLLSSFMPVISLGLGSPLIPSLGIGLAAIFLTNAVLLVKRTGNFSKLRLNIWRAFLFTCASAGAVAFGLSSFVYFSQFNIVLASAVLVVSTIVLGAFYCATSMQSDTVTVNQGQFDFDQETGQGGAERSIELRNTVNGLAAIQLELNPEAKSDKEDQGPSPKAGGSS